MIVHICQQISTEMIKNPGAQIRCTSHSFSWAERKMVPWYTLWNEWLKQAAQLKCDLGFSLAALSVSVNRQISKSWYLWDSEANWPDVGRHHLKIHAVDSPGSQYKKPHSPLQSKQTSVKHTASIFGGSAEICCCSCEPCGSDVIYAFPMTDITLKHQALAAQLADG